VERSAKKINLSIIFADKLSHQVNRRRYLLVSFMNYDLGYFDLVTRVLEPLENPFGPKLLPMWPVGSVTHVSGSDL
jgi:putative transposase